jgi:hypothetical protein
VTNTHRCRSPNAEPSDLGAVTVEAAIVVFSLVLVLAMGASAVMALVGQVLCTDAAREAARVIARGEPDRAKDLVQAIAPNGAQLTVHTDGDTVQVVVTAIPAGGLLPGVHLKARAFAVLEPGGPNG